MHLNFYLKFLHSIDIDLAWNEEIEREKVRRKIRKGIEIKKEKLKIEEIQNTNITQIYKTKTKPRTKNLKFDQLIKVITHKIRKDS